MQELAEGLEEAGRGERVEAREVEGEIEELEAAIFDVAVNGLGHRRAGAEAMISAKAPEGVPPRAAVAALKELHASLRREHLKASRGVLSRLAKRENADMAEKAHDRHVQEQARAEAEEIERRSHMPLPERLADCLAQARRLSTVSATSFDPKVSAGKASDAEPPRQSTFSTDRFVTPIRNALEDFEQALRAERGLGVAKDVKTMRGEAKDQEVLRRWVGVPAHVVSTRAPWLGTPSTIKRIRRENRKWPETGLDRPEKDLPEAA